MIRRGEIGQETMVNNKKIKTVISLVNNKAFFILILLILISQIATNGLFFTYDNLSSVFRQTAVSAILGVGFTALLASRGLDLSVGSMLSLIGCLYATMTLHIPLPLAILCAMAIGGVLGFCNGAISEFFSLPPFIVTLATAQIFKGHAYLLARGKSVSGLDSSVRYLGQGLIFDVIPISAIIVLILTVVMAVIVHRTRLGRYLIATGGNPEAATASGINVGKTRIYAYILTGICVALGAVVLTGRVSMAAPGAGEGMEMDVIAAVVIGGTPMSGGKARLGGTIFGCLIIGVMSNLLNLLGVSSFWQWVAKGYIILIAMLMDSQMEVFFSKRNRSS